MRRHTTSAFEFQGSGLLLAGEGEHRIRVLGVLARPMTPPDISKETLAADAAVFEPYFAGQVRGEQQDPDERPFHPVLPGPFLTHSGELEFLTRDWSGIDLDTVTIPPLPVAPGDGEPPPASEDAISRWRSALGPEARDGNDVVELVDGPETFRAMHAAIRTATGGEHYIYLLGWWLDLDEPLDVPTTGPPCPPAPRTGASTIRALLTAAAAAGVQVRVVLWDQTGSAKNTAEVAFVNSLPTGAAVLDNHQHAYLIGAHHQKLLVVKGGEGLLAFCGGVDINADRVCPAAAAPGGEAPAATPPATTPGATPAPRSGLVGTDEGTGVLLARNESTGATRTTTTFGTGTLSRGATGDGVAELQRWLIDRGFLTALTVPTGTFEDATEHALKAFQLSAGIGVDGVVGGGTRTAADGFSGTALSSGWHPSAVRNVQVNSHGGSFTTDTRRGVLHTTETPGLPGYTDPPHFTIGRDGAAAHLTIWQHYPITVAARALRHPSAAVQTNRHGAIQIEIIGNAADSPRLASTDPDLFTSLGLLMRWIESNAAVAGAAHHVFDGDVAYGESGSVRLSDNDWLASSGWLGHQHVPHNTHWDPGKMDIAGLLNVLSPSALSVGGSASAPAASGSTATGGAVASSGSSGGTGAPLHDVHCRIVGPAAHDLLGVFVKRWLSTSEHPALDAAKGPLRGIGEPVPAIAGPAIVRAGETYNATATLPAPPAPPPWPWWTAAGLRTFNDRTAQDILLRVIAGARRFIYIEDQYLIAMCAAEAIRRALPSVDHVTILIAASEISDLPRRWEFRRRFIDHVTSHPQGHKLRVFVLCDPAASGAARFGDHTYVHAKTIVVDDEVAVIGSANVNRRGWEHDSEVVAAVAGPGRDGTPVAQRLRMRLWAEHLVVAQSAVADPIASKGLWLSAPTGRVCRYNPSAATDPAFETLIGEDTIDPPFPIAGAPCCAIHPPSCPAGASPTAVPAETPHAAPTPVPAPVEAPAPVPTATADAGLPSLDRWGGYDLRRGDGDTEPRWAGAVRSVAAGDQMPAAGTDAFVRRLQSDLRELGFLLAGTPDGDFGRATEWAVRELQVHAKMAFLAQEAAPGPSAPAVYGDRLSQTRNTAIYSGPVSGVLNGATRVALLEWLANRWRCPVVIEALQGTAVVHENLWGKDDQPSSAPRMFARDWSGHFTLPAGVNAGDRMVLGDWQSAGHGGPSSRAPIHTRADAELTPDALVGVPLASLSPAQLSTYKVVRAVSEVECMGFFDSLNAWDNAVMSLGPCHWTLGLIGSGGAVDRGELCAYLALLRHLEPSAFATAFGFFGARPDRSWTDPTGVASGSPLFTASLRKYTAWLEQETDAGGFAAAPAQAADANYFRTWHWFHRFSMAGRTITAFRRRMWDMARIRLRDIRATPWGPGPPAVADVPTGGTPRGATIGDVATSEQALAMIMRWHVWRPAHVVSGGTAGPRLRGALTRAAIPAAAGHPGQWTDAHEQAMIDGLTAEAAALGDQGLIDSLDSVRNWHTWGAGGGPRGYALAHTVADLWAARGSLDFEGGGLPPAP